ncbi:DUF2007 domain-containing protein [Undibacterium sp. LX40W]|uniref:DUF2007 domain-containing protein n=1 Tax=Undibacterium nitidum TaxID=2762298 RepID=A0A923KNT2_9BURK|nr:MULTISPECIES: DUF2007 domain-containing protein [Undibacterium]MBC3881028.1 DUF2007 domain-containing protein [Undibacterium nitidum]MBC3890239.1 DUF2007 domain-containing protein [Undibacterium sp. LX40W]
MSDFKKLYDASNAIEAHMLRDLLEQHNIPVFFEGEHLQGGVGDLPATGFVRLVVEEEHYHAAANFIAEWDAKQADEVKTVSTSVQRFGGLPMFFMGFGLGLVLMYAYFFVPRYSQGGGDEGQWTYGLSGNPIHSAFDRNQDGKIDLKQTYDARGFIEKSESDDDFDGVFETITHYRSNNATITEVDSDRDGFHDFRYIFKDGVVHSTEQIYPTTGLSRKTCYFALTHMNYCELDFDLDGKMDTRVEYDELGEEKKRQKL